MVVALHADDKQKILGAGLCISLMVSIFAVSFRPGPVALAPALALLCPDCAICAPHVGCTLLLVLLSVLNLIQAAYHIKRWRTSSQTYTEESEDCNLSPSCKIWITRNSSKKFHVNKDCKRGLSRRDNAVPFEEYDMCRHCSNGLESKGLQGCSFKLQYS